MNIAYNPGSVTTHIFFDRFYFNISIYSRNNVNELSYVELKYIECDIEYNVFTYEIIHASTSKPLKDEEVIIT